MSAPAIETRGLTKVFPPKKRTIIQRFRGKPAAAPFTALAGVDLVVPKGQLFGLLGPNGAGKTTLVKILCTLLLPTEGEARIAGLDVRKDAQQIRQKVGVVLGGDRALYWRLTARENLWYFSQLYDMPRKVAEPAIERVLQQVDLLDRADDRVENYSKGMKQRLHIARGLLTDPEILLLDEPTIGLDPHAARSLRALVRKLVDEHGRTVVLTTHYMYEADELSDRIGVLHKGKIIAEGTSQELKATHAKDRVVVMRARAADGTIVERRAPGNEDPAHVAAQASKEGLEIIELRVEEPSLEDVFIALTGEGLTGREMTSEDE